MLVYAAKSVACSEFALLSRHRITIAARTATLIVAVALATLGWAAQAHASPPGFIYWSNIDTGRVGRANVDGTSVNQSFISGAHSIAGVAVDSKHVYWANSATGTIGRANLNGTDVDQSFISGASGPYGVAVDGQHIYWVNRGPGSNGSGSIGGANLDGTGVNQNLISAGRDALWVAVDGQHIYWTHEGASIGRANLDGSGVNPTFISGLRGVQGIAVDSNHIYWGQDSTSSIGRANLDGTGVNENFIANALGPSALAVEGGRLYWGTFNMNTVAVANVDGSGVLTDLVSGADEGGPLGVAVNGASIPQAGADKTKLDFGTHALGNFGTAHSVTVSDTGTAPLQISNVQLSGGEADDFLIYRDRCSGNVLRPGAGCSISVLFGPTALGQRSATLKITSDDSLSPLLIGLSGTGGASTAAAPPSDLITCKTLRRTVRTITAQCTGKLVPGMGQFTTAGAIVSQGAIADARGTAMHARGGLVLLSLRVLHPLRSGRYTLSLRDRRAGQWVTDGVPVRIG
jgi:virginiamycin B lyase